MLKPALGFLRALFGIGTPPVEPDGFGQSIADDIRFLQHFRQCRRAPTVWRTPTDDEAQAIDADPLIGRFGDLTIGVADVAGRRWIVRERDWHSWPDPPRFVFFAMASGEVWAGADFDRWPGAWVWPPERARMGLRP